MSDSDSTQPEGEAEPRDIESIEREIEQTRAELGATVDQLADKLDVKAQVGRRAESVKQNVSEKAHQAKAAAPESVQHALDTVGEKAGPVAVSLNDSTRPYRAKIAAGVALTALALLVLRRRRAGHAE